MIFTPDGTKLKKETKPGESYFKLKSELSRQIKEKRRDAIAKRFEEEEKLKKEQEIDLDEEEYEIGSGSEEEGTVEETCNGNDLENEEVIDEEVIDKEIDEEGANENEDNENISQSSEESGDENDENVHTTQKRRRIINHDDSDSDEGNLN